MQFRKKIKIFPGLSINISKSGISTSIGPKGATLNIKKGRKTKITTGLPGTGISQTHYLNYQPNKSPGSKESPQTTQYGWRTLLLLFAVLYVIVRLVK